MKAPTVEITFGGKSRHLTFDYNALAELQDLAGTFESDMPVLKALRATVWAGLLAETLDSRLRPTARTLSLKDVGDILTEASEAEIRALSEAVMQARGLSAPPEADRPPVAPENPA